MIASGSRSHHASKRWPLVIEGLSAGPAILMMPEPTVSDSSACKRLCRPAVAERLRLSGRPSKPLLFFIFPAALLGRKGRTFPPQQGGRAASPDFSDRLFQPRRNAALQSY